VVTRREAGGAGIGENFPKILLYLRDVGLKGNGTLNLRDVGLKGNGTLNLRDVGFKGNGRVGMMGMPGQ
jgi:hypothetical protein